MTGLPGSCATALVATYAWWRTSPTTGTSAEYLEKLRQTARDHDLPDEHDVIFVEVTVTDPSEFASSVAVRGVVMHYRFRVLTLESSTVPNALAALLLRGSGTRPVVARTSTSSGRKGTRSGTPVRYPPLRRRRGRPCHPRGAAAGRVRPRPPTSPARGLTPRAGQLVDESGSVHVLPTASRATCASGRTPHGVDVLDRRRRTTVVVARDDLRPQRTPVHRDGPAWLDQGRRLGGLLGVEVARSQARSPSPDRHQCEVDRFAGQVRHRGEERGVPGVVDRRAVGPDEVADGLRLRRELVPPAVVVGVHRDDLDTVAGGAFTGRELDDRTGADGAYVATDPTWHDHGVSRPEPAQGRDVEVVVVGVADDDDLRVVEALGGDLRTAPATIAATERDSTGSVSTVVPSIRSETVE